MIKIGELMPEFNSIDQHGNQVSSKNFLGKDLIVFFYPRDMTPTCTVEVCNLRDNYALLQQHGYTLIGVSADDVKQHLKFATKHQLPFPLLADVDRQIIDKFGVWGPKKFMGREIIGIYRTTFIINKKGLISHIFDKVKSKEHAQQILTELHPN